MNRLEYRGAFAGGSRREQAHGTADAGAFIGQDIAEGVLRHHHVEELRFLNHTHGGVVHIHIVGGDFRIVRSHFLRNLPPQARRGKHIRLVYDRKMLVALHGILKAYFQNAFNLRASVHIGVVSLVVVLILLAEVHAACQFADAEEIGSVHQFGTKRRLVQEALKGLHGTDVGKQS